MKSLWFLLTVCILNEFIYGSGVTGQRMRTGAVRHHSTTLATPLQTSESETQEGEVSGIADEGNIEENVKDIVEQSEEETVEESEEKSDAEKVHTYTIINGNIIIPFLPLSKKLKAEEYSLETVDSLFNEHELGDVSELFASNRHHFQPREYKDFGRRFVLQYPYSNAKQEDKIMPQKAPPEIVLAVAKESAMLEASKQVNPSEHIMTDKNFLRDGDYWNGVWQEDVNPKSQLRSKHKKKQKLNFVKAKIMPGSDLYELMLKLQRISPRLLYAINKKSKH